MSRKKPSLELPFCGVHEAEWKRLDSDALDLFDLVFSVDMCSRCDLILSSSPDVCVLCHVRYLADSRLDLILRKIEFDKKYPKLFDDSENNV